MEASMITSKKVMARKWQKIAAFRRKRIVADHSGKSSAVDKGCFVIYTIDKRRFAIPLAFLGNCIFHELFKMSEEEFGLPGDGPITLPCHSVVMRAVLDSIKTGRCAPDTHPDQQSLVCGF